MQKKQNGFTFVETMLVLIFVTLIGFIGWYVWQAQDDKKETTYTSSKESKAKPKQAAKETLPEGFTAKTVNELGLTFAYPSEWGELEQIPGTDSAIYAAGFSNTQAVNALSGENGYNAVLYANTGKQDFTNGGRGGALWDAVGFTKSGSTYSARMISVSGGGSQENLAELINPELIQAKGTETVLSQYDFFEQPVYQALVNLKGAYYGAAFVVDGNNTALKDQLKQVAATVQVK